MHEMDFLREEHGDDALDLMVRLKRAFDPLNILNPGKIVRVCAIYWAARRTPKRSGNAGARESFVFAPARPFSLQRGDRVVTEAGTQRCKDTFAHSLLGRMQVRPPSE